MGLSLQKEKKRIANNEQGIGDSWKKSKETVANTVSATKKKLVSEAALAKKQIAAKSNGELARRGKAAFDVLLNGDKDWMGDTIEHDDPSEEIRARGRAALERILYSSDQIDNKKFYGRYNF